MPEIDLGSVVGPQGKQGETGPAGAQGIQGIQGVPGKDATINGYNVLNLAAGGAAYLTQDGGNAVIAAAGRNLLDNACFASIDSIIDQRKGYVLVSGAIYYNGLPMDDTTKEEPFSVYTTVYNVTVGTSYTSFKLSTASDAVMYYAAPGNVVRGYVGVKYTIDRWQNRNSACILKILDDYISMEHSGAGTSTAQFSQSIENFKALAGKTVTLSSLVKGKSFKIVLTNGIDNPDTSYASYDEYTLLKLTATMPEDITGVSVYFRANTGGNFQIKAAKLELGSTQTLAHQDENGNWVLNDPPPDKTLELLKCLRYFYRLKIEDDLAAANIAQALSKYTGFINLPIKLPVPMRITPAFSCSGLEDIYYRSDANNDAAPTKFTVRKGGALNESVNLQMEGTFDTGVEYHVFLKKNGYMDFSAEL